MASSQKNIAKEFYNLRKKLLDLTLRNQLLNFKPRSKTLTITNQTPANMYHTLVIKDHTMTFAPNKKEETDQSRFRRIWDHPSLDLQIFKDGDKTLRADLSPSELQKRLFYINQQAKSMIQEQGYNILYVAVGFLKWKDRHKPKQDNLAPLILIPVEMERKNVGKSYTLHWTGEEIKTNISLKAKLLEDGIQLPEFNQVSNIEGVTQYLNQVKESVKSQNWEILNNVAIGFFSFTKFLMYNDLDPEAFKNSDIRHRYSLIEAIFNPEENIYEENVTEQDIDQIQYIDRYNVLDADSSQMAAIENVKAGHNLVVEGPPGTGKSQTIVNLISELLAEDKTVLFVSEKMAALDVVKSRMENVGLGKFVLELHSHKARRKKLLKDLERSTNVKKQSNLKIEQTIRKLELLRQQLDEYAEVIHKPVHKIQLSPFQLYGMKESSEDYFTKKGRLLPLVRFTNSENLTMKDLDEIIQSLESLAELNGTISKDNPWGLTKPKSLLPQDLREIEFLLDDTMMSLDNFLIEADTVNQIYGIKTPNSLKEYKYSIEALQLLDNSNTELIDPNIVGNIEWTSSPSKAHELITCIKDYQENKQIREKFNDNILTTDILSLIQEIQKESQKKFRLFGGSNYKNQLKSIYITEPPSDQQALVDLQKLQAFFNARHTITKYQEAGKRYFGRLWDVTVSYKDLLKVEEWMRTFTSLLVNGTFSEQTCNILKNDLYNLRTEEGAQEYLQAGTTFTKTLSKLEHKLNPRNRQIFKKEKFDVTFQEWQNQLQNWKGQIPSLHLWSQYLNMKNDCLKTNSKIFVETIEKRRIMKEDVKPLVLGNFADSLLNIVFNGDETLSTFIGELHENKIKEFRDLDAKMIQLNRKRLYNKLNNKIPQIFGAANEPENQVLAGEFTRKSGHLPVRTLLEKAGGTIKKIKPCFMMSPLSIAQYLDPTNEKLQFDVVIFDEASQVKPEDALGAFMRADTAVVMGDTQQLPPTSFFDQMTDADSDEEIATALDMESILHLCKLSFPVKMLKWHYRSRHESLISTSNKEFYDNELLIYPSPSHNDPDLGLKFEYHSDTYYDRGKGSNNIEEAKLVVKEVFRHFEKYGDTKSLGVGTFSVSQRNAIMEELEIQRKYHPELEPLFNEDRNEHFFVKNLETIQGDERDIIIISIGYGFDKERKLSLNFGPLNQEGGERRLNVLITRAREKCIVFSNFKASDMHLTHNPPFGVKALKNFLGYAETINYGARVQEETEEEPFEDAVYNFLTENGYNVDKRVGCAGFRMDLAVIDMNNPGRYILGIECDGKIYSSSKVATDRDRLRDQVLKGLGWNIYHLWSTDWYRNRDLARKRLLQEVETTQRQTVRNEISIELEAAKSMEILPVMVYTPADNQETEETEEPETPEIVETEPQDIETQTETQVIEEETEEEPPMFSYESPAYSEEEEEEEESIINSEIIETETPIMSEIIREEFGNSNSETETPIMSEIIREEPENIMQEPETPIMEEEIEDVIPEPENIIEVEHEPIERKEDPITFEIKPQNEEKQEESEFKFHKSLNESTITEELENIMQETDENQTIAEEEIIIEEPEIDDIVITPEHDLTEETQEPVIDEEPIIEAEVLTPESKPIEPVIDEEPIIEAEVLTPETEPIEPVIEEEPIIEEPVIDDIVITPEHVKQTTKTETEEIQPNINPEHNVITPEDEKIPFEYSQALDNTTPVTTNTEEEYEEYNDYEYHEGEYYEAATKMDNQLRKNNVVRKKNNKSHKPKDRFSIKSITESITDVKNEIKYIDDSLKEIENPTEIQENVYVIDRANENETIAPIKEYETEKPKPTEPETQPQPTKKPEPEIKETKDDKLEDLISDINEETTKEKRKNNVLKFYDDTKLTETATNMDELVPKYAEAKNIQIKNTKQLYDSPIDDVAKNIEEIIRQESPIHKDDLVLRLREACNLKRAGAKFKNKIDEALEVSIKNENVTENNNFLFFNDDRPVVVRRRVKPSIDLISDEEIIQNILLVVTLQKSLETKKLIKRVANNFGFKSTSKKTSNRITNIIDAMIINQILLNNDGRIELID